MTIIHYFLAACYEVTAANFSPSPSALAKQALSLSLSLSLAKQALSLAKQDL